MALFDAPSPGLGDEDDEVRPKKRARAEEMDDEALAEMRAEAMAYLREVREAQLVLSVPEGAAKGDDWRKEAVRRWGALAGAGKEDRDWKLFVESRLSTPPPSGRSWRCRRPSRRRRAPSRAQIAV